MNKEDLTRKITARKSSPSVSNNAKKPRLQSAQTNSQIADVLAESSGEEDSDDLGDDYNDSDDNQGRRKSKTTRPSSRTTKHPLSPSMFSSENEGNPFIVASCALL